MRPVQHPGGVRCGQLMCTCRQRPAGTIITHMSRRILFILGNIKPICRAPSARPPAKQAKPKAIAKREKAERHAAQEVVVLQGLQDHGPITSRSLAVHLRPWEPKELSKVLQRLKKQGRASCSGRTWSATT